MRFDEEVAVVTGAGRGLGAAYATLLAQRGCRVIVNDLPAEDGQPSPADLVVDAIRSAGGTAIADSTDITRDGAGPVAHAVDAWGRVDIVLNNAGMLARNPIEKVSLPQLRSALDVHVVAAAAVTQAAWPHLRASAGRVLLTASPGFFGIPGSVAYAAAKGGVLGLTRTLALEGADAGIRVNAIMPAAHTRMISGTPGARLDELMERHFDPAYVAAFVAWLVHTQNPLNGEIFTVGGGRAGRVILGETPGARAASTDPDAWAGSEERLMATDGFTIPVSAFDELRFMTAQLGGDVAAGFRQAFPQDS